MRDEGRHAAFVDAWLERCAKRLPSDRLLQLFKSAFAALWRRTNTTLGEVTLGAITQRVLYNAAEKFPLFDAVCLGPNGSLACDDLDRRLRPADSAELAKAIRFVLTEFLTVLGNLTAEILSEDLHAELGKVVLDPPAPAAKVGGRTP